jgi:5'-AMP-activated protein kinase, regulatory gamma subunit
LISQTLVRLGAYQSLDLTIEQALNERSPDFPGVVICTASDSLGTLLQLINKRRVHRLVVVEGDEDEKRGGRKGRLLGIITLTDVLRYIVGNAPLQEQTEPPEDKLQHPPQPQEPQLDHSQQQTQPEPGQSQPQGPGTADGV